MKNIVLVLILAATALLVAACSEGPTPPDTVTDTETVTETDTAADIARIRDDAASWITAWNVGDVDALMETYTDDAVEMAPDELHEGLEAIETSMRAYFAEFDATQTSNPAEVTIFGDVAVVRGTWSLEETPRAGGPAQTRTGKWVDVRRRQADGSWKTWRWMWNVEDSDEEAP